MNKVIEKIEQYKIVPVVTIKKIDDTEVLLNGLIAGGLPIAEICFRTDCAEQAISLAVKKYPEMLVGAGTVINEDQCKRALSVGAKFIVSPGVSEGVAEICRKQGVAYFPGVVTPTEIMQAISLGLSALKFFPAGNFGGLKTIKALSSAFPQVRFMPTGGVSMDNLKEFLSFEKVFACGGSWMMKATTEDIKNCVKSSLDLLRG